MSNHQTPNGNEFSHLKKLEYFRPDIIRLNLPFILTEDKMLVLGMPYLMLEGEHTDAIRLIDVWDNDGFVFLKIENMQSGKISTLSWSLGYDGNYILWSIASLEFLIHI